MEEKNPRGVSTKVREQRKIELTEENPDEFPPHSRRELRGLNENNLSKVLRIWYTVSTHESTYHSNIVWQIRNIENKYFHCFYY